MKSFKLLFLFLFTSLLITSCSSDDDNTDPGEISQPGNYFPSSLNNYWNFDVINTDNTNEPVVSTDSLYVASETGSVFTLEVNDNMVANGTMDSFLINGSLTPSENNLIFSGTLELPEEISDFVDFEINLSNVVLYDTEAALGAELSSNSSTIEQDFNGIPITINYELTTNALGFSESMSLNGEMYSNVITSDIKLNLNVTATIEVFGNPTTIAILESQDVLSITNYYAQAIGLVRSESESSYEISAVAITLFNELEIDVPPSGSGSNVQELSDYFVAE